ncbi:amino acid transporter [Polychaeton citri CBS 116435]|uniref:Amino acid transporter n=1 Tax=Polychaeton citri CBS 116435 TaxID=1314669 RepID=A0A9P4QF26_9PEZI|nr:amino acid transporter [Polychaeton citri CBS 116435]
MEAHELKHTSYIAAEEISSRSASPEDKRGTKNDENDMYRLGKKQELRRNFKFFSIVGFVTIMQATWESSLLASSFGLFNGGTAGVIWCTIAVWLCIMAMVASMAEMASMAPTAGGQYHWVSEFAPAKYEKPLSYVVGWCCCLGWVSGIPACGQLLAGLVEGMVLLVNPEANIGTLWQTSLLIFLFLFLTFAFNIFLAKYLPLAEGIVLVVHVIGFFAFLLTLWVLSDHVPAKRVFTEFQDGGGWGSIGLSTLVGLASPLWCFIGPDAGAHMSEELKDASLNLPRAMMWATFFNGIMGITMLITFCFCIPNIDPVINTLTGNPILQVVYNVTGSLAGTCVLGTLLVCLTFFSTVTVIASASRQCWAFARDRGFPFSQWIMRIPSDRDIPLNAILVCLLVSCVLAAINFGSDVALNAIVSVSNAALIFSYIISVGCLRLKRLRGEPLLPRRWSLGKFGGPLNDITLAFLFISFVFSFFPIMPMTNDPTWAADFNWAIVMFSATCLLALVYYHLGGKRVYVPPVRLVKSE